MVNYSDSRSAEEICESSSKMITFMDLAGHHKYLKTTVFGLTSYCPDFAMLVVGANTGIGQIWGGLMTSEKKWSNLCSELTWTGAQCVTPPPFLFFVPGVQRVPPGSTWA